MRCSVVVCALWRSSAWLARKSCAPSISAVSKDKSSNVTSATSVIVEQGDETSAGVVQPFYSALSYADELRAADVPHMSVELLPFQKEGVGWMAQREMHHVGGIMADHLGMGKTLQMIGLCLVSERVSQLSSSQQLRRRALVAEGYRLLTVLRQLQKISVIANCSRINRPARELGALNDALHTALQLSPEARQPHYAAVRGELDKWLVFAGKFHPHYATRATTYLDDEERKDFELIASKELRTLVVVPAALMLQWKSELETKVQAARALRVYLYHGGGKWISSVELATYDFVITTYDTLTYSASAALHVPDERDDRTYTFSREHAGPLFHVRWKRVILDEAHMVRHARTQRWKAVQELQGVHRWAVTATPLHNSIDDLQNLLYFVGLPRLPVLPGSSTEDVLNDAVLQRSIAQSLQPAFLRRGPVMVYNGRREVLVQLPPKSEVVIKQAFSLHESRVYNDILARSRSALAASSLVTHGSNAAAPATEAAKAVPSGTARKGGPFHIFAMMTRLRQACCHMWLHDGKAVEVAVCGICGSEAATAVVRTPCKHTFCHECLLQRFRDAVDGDTAAVHLPCPTCNIAVPFKTVFMRHAPTSAERIAKYKARELELSTKLRMLLHAYHTMRRDFPDDKMIIFSHFTTFIDVIAVAFEHYHIDFLRLDGTMTLTHRNVTIRHFHNADHIRVILASKTATGVGLNLTVANHVLVVDPWWNPAIEEQAVHRCYRIGQKKPVYVTRFIIADTIEQYCYEICQRKKEFGDAVLRAATSGNASSAKAATSKLYELIARLKYIDEQNARGDSSSNSNTSDAASDDKQDAAAAAAASATT